MGFSVQIPHLDHTCMQVCPIYLYQPLMIAFTIQNQILCDFTHCGTHCLTLPVSAALPDKIEWN